MREGYDTVISIRLPAMAVNRLRERAARADRSVSALARRLVLNALEEDDQKPAQGNTLPPPARPGVKPAEKAKPWRKGESPAGGPF